MTGYGCNISHAMKNDTSKSHEEKIGNDTVVYAFSAEIKANAAEEISHKSP